MPSGAMTSTDALICLVSNVMKAIDKVDTPAPTLAASNPAEQAAPASPHVDHPERPLLAVLEQKGVVVAVLLDQHPHPPLRPLGVLARRFTFPDSDPPPLEACYLYDIILKSEVA